MGGEAISINTSRTPGRASSAPPPVACPPDQGRFGRYQLCFEVASGGMATVYLAHTLGPAGIHRLLALKRIHRHLATEEKFVRMFLDEARIASKISHPNVCGVIDFGEVDGTYYIAMEYLMGEPLANVQRALARNTEERRNPHWHAMVASIIADACEGLHAAHELRDEEGELLHVVHRDISPQNLFVTYQGSVQVVDFGIATAKNSFHVTQTGSVKGKFAYMAPEQMRGLQVDRRADIWSMGVVLWETLALKRLFKRSNDSETVLAVVQLPIPRVRQIRPDIPEELDEIVARALSRDPDERYATARDLGRDLARFVVRQPDTLGMPERAEWMERLFPEGYARKQELVQVAMQLGQSASAAEEMDAGHWPSGSFTPPPRDSFVRRTTTTELSVVAPPSYRWMLGALSALCALLAAGLIAVLQVSNVGLGQIVRAYLGLEPSTETRQATAKLPAKAGGHLVNTLPAKERSPSATPPPSVAELKNKPREGKTPLPPKEEKAAPDNVAKTSEVEARVQNGAESPAEKKGVQAAAKGATPTKSRVARAAPSKKAASTASERKSEDEVGKASANNLRAKAREPARKAVTPTMHGTVNLVTLGGWADVYFEGRKLGQSPMRFSLPVGMQSIELRPFGQERGRKVKVQVDAEDEARLRINLKP